MNTGVTQTYITVGESLGYSLLGFSIVFVALVLLICLITLIARVFREKPQAAASAPAASQAAPVLAAGPPAGKVPATGSLGELALHNVDDKTAALLMAIVADKMNAPLNELRFISIKEVNSK